VQEILDAIKAHYLNPRTLNQEELNRATLQGLLERLGAGVQVVSTPAPVAAPAPSRFLHEVLEGRVGYARIGTLAKENLAEFDTALDNLGKRASNRSSLTCAPRRRAAISNSRPKCSGVSCQRANSFYDPKKWRPRPPLYRDAGSAVQRHGRCAPDKETSGAPEVIAAALRSQAGSVLIGETSAGQAVEYAEIPLRNNRMLRVAVAEVVPGDNVAIHPGGVTPDLVVELPVEARREIMRRSYEQGLSQFVFEVEHPRMNEASLVAGTNPEIDAMQAQRAAGGKPKPPLLDTVLHVPSISSHAQRLREQARSAAK